MFQPTVTVTFTDFHNTPGIDNNIYIYEAFIKIRLREDHYIFSLTNSKVCMKVSDKENALIEVNSKSKTSHPNLYNSFGETNYVYTLIYYIPVTHFIVFT